MFDDIFSRLDTMHECVGRTLNDGKYRATHSVIVVVIVLIVMIMITIIIIVIVVSTIITIIVINEVIFSGFARLSVDQRTIVTSYRADHPTANCV